MNELQKYPNRDYPSTVEEVRTSMMRWFGEAMPEYTTEQWRTFKAHLYPEPVASMPGTTGPDLEQQHIDRMDETMPNSFGA
jgi:hypothetical protein